jgi:hypothetical protein
MKTYSAKILQIAKVCHEVNKAYCESIGDYSQVPWDNAPNWQRDSACNGVIYHQTNIHSTPADSHNNWLAEKKAEGWIYGAVKDAEKKEHPCFVPYDLLPKNQQTKDHLFLAVVRAYFPSSV